MKIARLISSDPYQRIATLSPFGRSSGLTMMSRIDSVSVLSHPMEKWPFGHSTKTSLSHLLCSSCVKMIALYREFALPFTRRTRHFTCVALKRELYSNVSWKSSISVLMIFRLDKVRFPVFGRVKGPRWRNYGRKMESFPSGCLCHFWTG